MKKWNSTLKLIAVMVMATLVWSCSKNESHSIGNEYDTS